MDSIPKATVERITRNLATQPTREMSVEAARFNREQPLLSCFVSAFSSQLPATAEDLTLYLAYLLWRIFEESGATVDRVSADTILEQIHRNRLFIERFARMAKTASGGCLAELEFLSQPNVLRYLTGMLFDAGSCGNMAERHKGYMFFVLKTTLDSLNVSSHSERRRSSKYP